MLLVTNYNFPSGEHANISTNEVEQVLQTLRDKEKVVAVATALATAVETISLDIGLGSAILLAIIAYSKAVRKCVGVSAFCAFLQFRLKATSPNLLVLLMRLRRNPGFQSFSDYILDFMVFAGKENSDLDRIIDRIAN